MPVLRQDVNTGSGQLQLGNTNYMVGAAAPVMKQEQPETDSRGMAIQNFLQGFMGSFTPELQKGQNRAAAQGQIDASSDPNALEDADTAAGKQNIFMRQAYQQGYLGAAVQQTVNDFQAGATARAQQAGIASMSDEEFLAQERQHSAQLMQGLGKYLPHVGDDTVQAVANALDNTKTATLNMLRKSRAGQAAITNNRAVQQGSYQASQNFLQSYQTDGFDGSWHYIQDQANLIGTNPLLKQEDKEQELRNLAVTTAQQLNDPRAISQLADKFDGILGVNSTATHNALYGAYQQAAQRTAGASVMDVQNRFDAISKLPTYQQDDARKNLDQYMIQLNTTNQLSTGQMMDYHNKMYKEQKPTLQLEGLVQAAAQNHGALSVESLHASGQGQLSYDQIHSSILNNFPDTVQGNAALMASGQAGGDAWMIQSAMGRMGKQLTTQLSTLSVNMQSSTDDQGNKTYTVPQSVRDNLVGFSAMYQSADAVTKQTLMGTLPDDWKGIIQNAIAQDPNNMNNNILDTVKRVAAERASGLYKDVPSMPTGKAGDTIFDGSQATGFFSRVGAALWTTDNVANQRAQFSDQLKSEYTRIRNADPSLLSGKSPSTIHDMLVGNVQARTVSVKVGNYDSNIVLPAGTNLQQYAQAAGVPPTYYQQGLQSAASSTMSSMGLNPDNVQSVRILPNAGGALSKDFVLTVETKNPSTGILESHSINMPAQAVQAAAQGPYQDALASQRADGSKRVGTNLTTFYDHTIQGRRTGVIQGPNSAGMDSDDFNRTIAKTMQYEGFKGTKSGGSVGYGWHDASGDSVPDSITHEQAYSQLRSLMETRYVPMAKQYSAQAGLKGTYALGMLSDLAYERPADAKAVASAMGQFQRGEIQYPDLLHTLQKLPSWSDAGGGAGTLRNRDRLSTLQTWSAIEGNRGARSQENPFATLGGS